VSSGADGIGGRVGYVGVSSGGSTVVSGSSICVREVVTSTEVNGVAETSRQVSRTC
jgi:hypothetical protein